MAEPAGPFYLLQAGPGRYLCYCHPSPGPAGTVYVTDALDVWARELGACPPLGCACTGARAAGQAVSGHVPSPPQQCPPEEQGTKLREALERGDAALSLGEGKATLRLPEEAQCSVLELFKLPVTEARSQVQALVFGMARRVRSLESRLGVVETLASSCSPEKNTPQSHQLFLPDLSSRKTRGADSALLAKRKIPGESLINPGFKSKKTPSGVDFEDC